MTPLDRLLALPRFADAGAAAYRPGLDRMRALLAGMGHPERAAPSIHVAGTNGKGSTASMAAAIASAAGLRVGLHTSPHLLHVGERMRVGGVPASEAWLSEAAERHADLFARVEPSFFEATTALAFWRFAEAAVDLAVVEVGLGGRLDATNVLTPRVSIVTSVGLDHTDLLGGTLAEIAREKAGIARSGVPLLHAVDDAAARAPIEATAAAAGAPVEAVRATCRVGFAPPDRLTLATPSADWGQLVLGLPGAHQAWNAALAVRACEIAVPGLTPHAVAHGLANVARLSGLRGRGERVGDGVVLDVAHNADGWRVALESALDAAWPGGCLFVLVGVMADKDATALARTIAGAGAVALPVGLPGDRALDRDALVHALRRGGADVADAGPTVAHALAWFDAHREAPDGLLVTGSFVTVAEALTVLEA